MRLLNKEAIDSISVRLKDKFPYNKILLDDIEDLKNNLLLLLKENSFLKSRLDNLEQSLPNDQQWQNIISSLIELSFLHNNKKDFLEINNSINNQTYSIIIQKKFGKTPQQLLDSSEIRRFKLVKKNVALHKHIKALQDQCTKYRNEILGLQHISGSFKNEKDVEFSRSIVEAAARNAEMLVTKFNNNFVKYHQLKLHTSFSELFREVFSRANEADRRLEKLTAENKKIKRMILQKKYPLCRIYKGRLKRG